MRAGYLSPCLCLCLAAFVTNACGGGDLLGSVDRTVSSATAGSVPDGLPRRLMVGLYAQHGDTWMGSSGVPWDARFRFFAKGWSNNFGTGSDDGSWATTYMNEADAHGEVPVLAYIELMGTPGNDDVLKIQDTTTMAAYFAHFKLLMQRVRDFGKPVVVLLENTAFGYIEVGVRHDPTASAAVASSGLAELADLPNSVAGWGLAFLRLRRSVGAMNAKLAIDVASWASGLDVPYVDSSVPLPPEVERTWAFLGPMGLWPNATGDTYDLLSQHVSDDDFDYSKLVLGKDVWWDATDAASASTRSFTRYLAWLTLWNQRAARRWVLWEVPVGNSNHLNADNVGQARGGYRDNRVEWIFGPSSAEHRQALARAGVSMVLCGLAATAQASVTNDYDTDGQLFMQTHAGAFLKSGGLTLP
jgi:hypothetical protein